jgi:hypothetical protein
MRKKPSLFEVESTTTHVRTSVFEISGGFHLKLHLSVCIHEV